MVFPIGAQIWELAADHLDRLPGKSLIDGLVHERCVAENGHARSTNQPHEGRKRRSNETQWDGDDEQTRVELRRGGTEGADFEIATVEAANDEHADDDKDDVEEQEPVGEQSVDAQHGEDDGIVARVVAEVVVDAGLDLTKVGRLGEALEVEKLGYGLDVGEAAAEGTGAEAREAILKVEARRQGVEGNLNARHDVGVVEDFAYVGSRVVVTVVA